MKDGYAYDTVSMIHPQAWENERKLVEITPPIPVSEWAGKTDRENERLEMLPYDSLIGEGRYAGGHVLALHTEGTTQLWAVPPEVILFLKGILPDDEYDRLRRQKPSLTDVAARQRVKTSYTLPPPTRAGLTAGDHYREGLRRAGDDELPSGVSSAWGAGVAS